MKGGEEKKNTERTHREYTSPSDRTHLIIISYRIGSTRVCIPHTIELYTRTRRKKHMFCSFFPVAVVVVVVVVRRCIYVLFLFFFLCLRFRFLLNGQYSVHTHYITFVYNLFILHYILETIPFINGINAKRLSRQQNRTITAGKAVNRLDCRRERQNDKNEWTYQEECFRKRQFNWWLLCTWAHDSVINLGNFLLHVCLPLIRLLFCFILCSSFIAMDFFFLLLSIY